MKTNQVTEGRDEAGSKITFARACLKSCQAALAHLRHAKATILAEARETLQVHDRILQLALNEAEAVARQTSYPHLLFPALAAEKVRSAATWNSRQQNLNRRFASPTF
jgi:hypothetical protein